MARTTLPLAVKLTQAMAVVFTKVPSYGDSRCDVAGRYCDAGAARQVIQPFEVVLYHCHAVWFS